MTGHRQSPPGHQFKLRKQSTGNKLTGGWLNFLLLLIKYENLKIKKKKKQ
jgi:hypothetical protein